MSQYDPRLGRLEAPDDRDRNFPMRTLLPDAPQRTWRYWYPDGHWWDQGNTGTCVGHAWAHWIEDGPVTHAGKKAVVDPIELYLACTKIDPWPENDNGDLFFGTSTRAGAKVLQDRGFISEYRWAWDIDTVVTALLTVGPVVVGTNWYSEMFQADAEDFIHVGGSVVGGHAYLLNGVNTKRGLIRLKNSWGRNWVNNGHAYISIEDMGRLISERGDACLAVEIKSTYQSKLLARSHRASRAPAISR